MVPNLAQLSTVLLLGLSGGFVAWCGRGWTDGTTLSGPWKWMVLSIAAVSLGECAVLFVTPQAGALFRQAAATSTFCPVVSLLGAKRPQDRGWHFVVASLWLVLCLPVLEAVLLTAGSVPDIGGLRSLFLYGLVGLGLLNALPTRFWLAATLFAVAQLFLLWDASTPNATSLWPARGLLAFVVSLVAALILARRSRSGGRGFDRLWLDFRDAYGLLWSLRVAEQVNISAANVGWNLRLRLGGFRRKDGSTLDDSLPAKTEEGLRQNLNNLLRRFVSPEWIAERLPPQLN